MTIRRESRRYLKGGAPTDYSQSAAIDQSFQMYIIRYPTVATPIEAIANFL